MTTFFASRAFLATAVALTVPPATLYLYTRFLPYSYTISPSLLNSQTYQTVNPRNHITTYDTFTSPRLSIPSSLSDDQILARFTKGFFGRRVFWFERTLFSYVIGGKHRVAGYTGFEGNAGLQRERRLWRVFNLYSSKGQNVIWSPEEISRDKILPVGTIFYGGFQILASHITQNLSGEKLSSPEEEERTGSYVDVGFGSDLASFAGAHRFEVLRVGNKDKEDGEDREEVVLRLSHFRCNPSVNELSPAEGILVSSFEI
jgi:hypothetical protein